MQVKPDQLAGLLQKQLAPVYLLCGDEPQQLGELADLIRQTAKAQGYSSRELFFVEKNFDWKRLSLASDTLSIFADKKIIDLKLSGTPGQDGSKALIAYCQRPPEDTLLLITTGKITKESQKSSWFQAIDKAGCVIQVWPLAGQEFMSWVQDRMRKRGMIPETGAAKLLADRVEGNLLAAAQEVEKLHVLFGEGKLGPQQIIDAVADSSRYDVFRLLESSLAGQVDKVLKILSSLQAEGVASAVVLWALVREARVLVAYKTASSQNEKATLLRNQGVWGERRLLIETASKRLSHVGLNQVLVLSAKADRQIKGQQQGDAWETLLEGCLRLASVPVFGKAGPL